MNKKIIRIKVCNFTALQIIIVVQNAADNICLLKRCKKTIQLKPNVAANFFNLLQYRCSLQFRILKLCNKQSTKEKIMISTVSPFCKIIYQISIMQAMN